MLYLMSFCDKSSIVEIMLIVKTIFKIACYLAPLLVIIISIIHIFKSVMSGKDDDLKDALKVTVKRVIAGLLIAFLPALINYFFTNIVSTKEVEFLACFESATKEKVASLRAKEESEAEAERKSQEKEDAEILKKAWQAEQKIKEAKKKAFEEWQRTHKTLDFSCTSETVKAKFSCGTLKIVEKHLYDLNAQNFYDVINSYGGFENYAKSVGGIFGKYYGQTIEGRTKKDFQTAAEYVLGWMFMYGWDYESGTPGAATGVHHKWGGGSYTPDAFYVNGGWQTKYKGKFDEVISGKNGIGMMASECGDLEVFIYEKMGIDRSQQLPKPTKLKDLKVGDCIYFFDHRVDKTNEENWGIGTHNAVVGEVYSDHIVIYDGGSYIQSHRDYKRIVNIPNEYSEDADYAAIKETFGYDGWGIRRWYNFE